MRLSEQWRKKKQEKPEEGTTIAELVAIPCEFADKLADAVDQRDVLLSLYRQLPNVLGNVYENKGCKQYSTLIQKIASLEKILSK
jgi:uncharacterized protein YutE (UPF0331/DUF86 family)